jgi:hypothetical protein
MMPNLNAASSEDKVVTTCVLAYTGVVLTEHATSYIMYLISPSDEHMIKLYNNVKIEITTKTMFQCC